MRYNPSNRRVFLQGMGGALLALPFMPSLSPRSYWRKAEASPPTTPRRFVAIKTYNGTPVRAFYPGAQPGYETHGGDDRVRLRDDLPVATGRHSDGNEYFAKWAPLSDFAGQGVSQVFGTSFNRHHANMLLLRGMDIMPNLNHNHGAILGNFGLRTNGVGGVLEGAQINTTADQIMARSPCVYPNAPAGPRLLHLGSRTNTFSYAPSDPSRPLATGLGAVQRAQAYTNPRIAFDAVFPTGGSEPAPVSSVGARLVDRVIDDYRRAMAGPNLSGNDRQLLDQHMTRLSELEASLDVGGGGGGGAGCNIPAPPSNLDTGGEFSADPAQVQALFERMVDIIVLAFACDLTRVVTLDVAKMVIDDGGNVFGMGDSENANSAGRENWHFQAHAWDQNAQRWLSQGAQWVAQQVVLRLLDGLDATTDADGNSTLYNSSVIWSNELSFNHLGYSLPTALFGQGGGTFRGGRYIDFIDHERPVRFRQHDGPVIEGVQYNRFVVSLLDAMGVPPSEYEQSPGAGFGESQAVGKNDAWAIDYDTSNIGQPLPLG